MQNKQDKRTEKFHEMLEAPVDRLILKLAIPSILSMLTTSFYNMADTFFVSKLDTSSTAAVGVTFASMSIIQALGFFFGQGSGTYMARELGAQRIQKCTHHGKYELLLCFYLRSLSFAHWAFQCAGHCPVDRVHANHPASCCFLSSHHHVRSACHDVFPSYE